MTFDLKRRAAAEFMGTGALVCAVVGSGIMAERLTADTALALLANALATAAILVVLITTLGPISGAHFTPAVTAVFTSRGKLPGTEALAYVGAPRSPPGSGSPSGWRRSRRPSASSRPSSAA